MLWAEHHFRLTLTAPSGFLLVNGSLRLRLSELDVGCMAMSKRDLYRIEIDQGYIREASCHFRRAGAVGKQTASHR